MPKPCWMLLPQLRSAQGGKTVRRRRLVAVQRRVLFGPMDRVKPVRAACSWQINPTFVERLNWDIRQRVATVGRRVNPLCQHEAVQTGCEA